MKRGVAKDSLLTYQNYASGEFTPSRGFDIARTKFGSLNISIYAMARYLNQMPGHQTWYDHLGRPRDFVGRNDFFWHRVMIWFSGWLGTPKLTYTATVWTVFTTQQTLVYGNLQYQFNKHFRVGFGEDQICPCVLCRGLSHSTLPQTGQWVKRHYGVDLPMECG